MQGNIQSTPAAPVARPGWRPPDFRRRFADAGRAGRRAWLRLAALFKRQQKPPFQPQPAGDKLRATELFVNRETPIKNFSDAVRDIDPKRAAQLIVFYGAGGQGKSHLCRRFRQMLDDEHAPLSPNLRWGVVDLHRQTERRPEYFLLWVRNALKRSSKVTFPAFDLAFELFWKEARANEPMPRVESSWLDEFGTQAGAGVGTALLTGMPFIGSILGKVGRHITKEVRREALLRSEDILKELYSGKRLLSVHEIERRLPRVLAHDLAGWRDDHPEDRFVILIDEYEGAYDDGGVGNVFRENPFDEAVRSLVEQSQGTLFAFFLREKLKWANIDPKWKAAAGDDRQHLLEGLTRADAELFLSKSGIQDRAVVAAMVEGATALDPKTEAQTCYPIMLDMQVELYRSLSDAGGPVAPRDFRIAGDVFGSKRHELLGRLLRRYSEQQQATLRALAAARQFDQDLFEHVLTELKTGYPASAWGALKDISLVLRGDLEGVYTFHNVIREGLVASLSSDQADATHRALFHYYSRRLTAPTTRESGAGAAFAASEAFHQASALDPKIACRWWSRAGRDFRHRPSSRLFESVDRAAATLAAQVHGENSFEHGRHLKRVAQNLEGQRRHEDAVAIYKKALMVLGNAGAGDTPLAASALCSLGICLDFARRHEEAETPLRAALKIRQAKLAPKDPDVAQSLTALGMNQSHQKNFRDAEQFIQEALAIEGEETAMGATMLSNLGDCFCSQRTKRAKAEVAFTKAFDVRKKLFGEDDFRVGQSHASLGFVLDLQERYAEALPHLERARAIAEAAYGLELRETATRIRALGRTLHNAQQYARAEGAHREALAIRERVLGPGHPDTAESCFMLGLSLYRGGKLGEAIIYLRRSLEMRETILGVGHASTKQSARMLGEAYVDMSKD